VSTRLTAMSSLLPGSSSMGTAFCSAGHYAHAQYVSIHATVVKHPLYASLYSFTTFLGGFVYALPPVKLPLTFAKNRVYPHFEPTLKPYLDDVVKYLAAFENHIQPRVDPPANAAPGVVSKKAKSSASKVSKQAKANMQQVVGAVTDSVIHPE
jgi:hypothetical protein